MILFVSMLFSFLIQIYNFDIPYNCQFLLFDKTKGTFKSPNFPHPSPLQSCFIYHFAAPEGNSIKLSFNLFSLAPRSPRCLDFIRIYENLNTSQISTETPYYSEYCGSQIKPNEQFISKHNNLFIIYLQETGKSHGFSGKYETLSHALYRQNALKYSEYEFETFTYSGNLFSPGAPYHPPKQIKAFYNILSLDKRTIVINFTFFDFPLDSCNTDYINVYEVRSNGLLEQVCSHSKYPLFLASAEGFKLEYVTGKEVDKTQGFRLNFYHLPKTIEDISHVDKSITAIIWNELKSLATQPESHHHTNNNHPSTQKSGSSCPIKIISPRARQLPENEGQKDLINSDGIVDSQVLGLANKKCHIIFIGAPGEVVQLSFTKFNLQVGVGEGNGTDNKGCQDNDHVTVHVLISSRMSKISDFCHSQEPPQLMSPKNVITLEYVPKDSDVLRSQSPNHGFQLRYRFFENYAQSTKMISATASTKKCLFTFNMSTALTGSIESINHPGFYPRNLECEYIFIGQENYIVAIHFDYFEIEGLKGCEDSTQSDYVLFSNYKTVDRTNRRFCGVKPPNAVIMSESNYFRMLFKTNDIFDATGFYAQYQFLNTQTTSARIKFSAGASSGSKVNLTNCAYLGVISFILNNILHRIL